MRRPQTTERPGLERQNKHLHSLTFRLLIIDLICAGRDHLSVLCPADRGDSGERQTCAETELGWQRN